MTDQELLQESTRAIVHVARTIITVKQKIAAVAADGAFDARGLRAMLEDNERVLNGVGDVLDAMEGFAEDEEWVGKIAEAVRSRCLEWKPNRKET